MKSINIKQSLRVLNLKEGAKPDDVKSAFRRLALIHHPDKGGCRKEFVRIRAAYDCLCKHGTKISKQMPIRGQVVWYYTGTVTVTVSNTGTGPDSTTAGY